ncbi:MAG: hypothetical protein NT129_06575 [Candidatus Aenigmarchaeota archaeon]|nr:hypothetical protein [Candidatus Aenigmarchaeota archaeon]
MHNTTFNTLHGDIEKFYILLGDGCYKVRNFVAKSGYHHQRIRFILWVMFGMGLATYNPNAATWSLKEFKNDEEKDRHIRYMQKLVFGGK